MVKYGKDYRELQIKEFAQYYIDYKKLKQKIKAISKLLPNIAQNIDIKRSTYTSISARLLPSLSDLTEYPTLKFIYEDKYGNELKSFIELLDEEFKKCFNYFKSIERNLRNKVNRHLYNRTKYSSYDLNKICNEANSLKLTVFLSKCLNSFVYDNMMAMKKILKKFDKKFSHHFGEICPIYILNKLCSEKSELEYLLQFKIIDETNCICESNLKLLRDLFCQILKDRNTNFALNKANIRNTSITINDINENKLLSKNEYKTFFWHIYNDVIGYFEEIDDMTYFKIQYKEWFYFLKNNNCMEKLNNSKLFNNLMYNRLLISPFDKDNLIYKFLSRKEAFKEIKNMQIPLSIYNKINIVLIFIEAFLNNTLISSVYPLLFYKDFNGNLGKSFGKSFIFLIISLTYFCSFFSLIFGHYFGNKRIKFSYVFSYILFLSGSLCHIFENSNSTLLLIISRILIGFGTNPTIGKKYILTYSQNYYLTKISKYYVINQIIGYSFGPLIGFILYIIAKKGSCIPVYTKFNCIGWYGCIFSFILLIIHLILFTSPNSPKFFCNKSTEYKSRENSDNFLIEDDDEENQNKQFYKLQKEIKNNQINGGEIEIVDSKKNNTRNKSNDIIITAYDENKSENSDDNKSKKSNALKKVNSLTKDCEIDTISDFNTKQDNYEIISSKIFSIKKDEENLLNKVLDVNEGSFSDIDMIPRTITDLIRNEKENFSYINRNLLVMLSILFFNSILKENSISYLIYYILDDIQDYYLYLIVSLLYFLQIVSILFIKPLYKFNERFKKIIIILMIITLLLIIPLAIKNIPTLVYLILIIFAVVISSIIEVISSCYLAYLIPPDWKWGSFPFLVTIFGKFSGCLICLSSFTENLQLNHYITICFIGLGYLITGFYMIKSKNIRIKAITKIMRKA